MNYENLLRHYRAEWLKIAQKDAKYHAELVALWEKSQIGFTVASILLSIGGIYAYQFHWVFSLAGALGGITALVPVWDFQKEKNKCSQRWLGYRHFDLQMADKFRSYYER
jgi:hypothetical protein